MGEKKEKKTQNKIQSDSNESILYDESAECIFCGEQFIPGDIIRCVKCLNSVYDRCDC